jgi:hypothetical protein
MAKGNGRSAGPSFETRLSGAPQDEVWTAVLAFEVIIPTKSDSYENKKIPATPVDSAAAHSSSH